MDPREKISAVLDYLFGKNTSSAVPLEELKFTFSRKTGRIRQVWWRGQLVFSVRPDGTLALTLEGARLLLSSPSFRENCVIVSDESTPFVADGKSVFTKYVVDCGQRIRPQSEVAVLDTKGNVIAVGRAVLSAKMMKAFKTGVAVRVRKGSSE